MFSAGKVVSKALMALAVVVMGVALWYGLSGSGVTAQWTACAPGESDKVDISSLRISGNNVDWTPHPKACGYRVILRSKPDDITLHTLDIRKNTGSYTIPAELVSEGEKYDIVINILDLRGKVAGKGVSKAFTYSATETATPTPIPTCEPRTVSDQTGITPSPTPLPDLSTLDSTCLWVPPEKEESAASEEYKYKGTPGPGSGLGFHNFCGDGPCVSESTDALGAVASSAGSFAFADHAMKCSSSGETCPDTATGINHIGGNATGRVPSLPEGNSWNDYHYYNRMHISHPGHEITCPLSSGISYTGPEHISVGFATGLFGNTVHNNEIIVEKYFRDVTNYGKKVCEIIGTGRFHDNHAAIYFKIHRSDYVWEVVGWFGEWVTLDTIHTTWVTAPSPVFGQEIWARNGDLHNIKVPLNFIHKVNIGSKSKTVGPWHGSYIENSLRTRSYDRADAPFAVNDLAFDDRTSISSCITVNNLCE